MVRSPAVVDTSVASMLGSRVRRYPGRYLGAGTQRRGITASRKPLRSDDILQSVQRSRRNSHQHAGSAPLHASKELVSVAAPPETVLSQRCEFNAIHGMADADEVEAMDVRCHSTSYEQDPGTKAEPLLLVGLPSMSDDAGSACTFADCHSEVLSHAEVSCVAGPIGHEMDLPTACVSGTSGLQAKLSADLSEEDASPSRGESEMIQVDHSLHHSSSSGSSSSSSSVVPTPRKPNREEAHGRSKCEIEAVLSLRVVSEQLRARSGKADECEGADTWAQLAAAGA